MAKSSTKKDTKKPDLIFGSLRCGEEIARLTHAYNDLVDGIARAYPHGYSQEIANGLNEATLNLLQLFDMK